MCVCALINILSCPKPSPHQFSIAPRTSSWSVLRQREASGGCARPGSCFCRHRDITPSLLVVLECNPLDRYLKRTSQWVGWVWSLSVPNVAIHRAQESATGSIKQTHRDASGQVTCAGNFGNFSDVTLEGNLTRKAILRRAT